MLFCLSVTKQIKAKYSDGILHVLSIKDRGFSSNTFLIIWSVPFQIANHFGGPGMSEHHFFSFLVRNICPELTSVADLPLFYVGGHQSMAWWAILGPCLGSEPAKPWATEPEHADLTTQPQGRPPWYQFFSNLVSYFPFYFGMNVFP